MTATSHPPQDTKPAETPARRRVRWPVVLTATGIVVVLALAIAASWLTSENALVTLLDYAVERSGGRLSIDAPRGTLLGRIHIGHVVYRDETMSVTADDLTIDHAARSLLSRRLTLRELVAKRVRIDVHHASETPATMPESLQIPIDVTIERALVERLEWVSGESHGELAGLRFAYAGDQHQHRLKDVDVRGAGGRLAGDASIATTRPFATSASLTLDLVKPHPEGRVQAKVDGTLQTLSVVAKSTLAGIAADASARIAPFADQPLLEGRIDAKDVDLARLDGSWPSTRLAVVVDAKPSPGGFSGQARLTNALPGPVDANRIPVARLEGAFRLSGVTLELRELVAEAGTARVAGVGTVNIDTFENRWKLVVERLDLNTLHGSLASTSLSGRIEADVKERVQRIVADVTQKDVALSLDAHYDGRTIVVDRVLAQARDGSLEGSGRIALAGDRPFSADLRARRFNPARFGAFPAGSLDGTIVASGTASPTLAAEADVAIAPGSRLAGLPAQGRIRGRFAPASVQSLVADVALGANRVQATGAVGRPGDRVSLVIGAKRLAELAPLLPPDVPQPVTGALEARAIVETLARGASLEIDARGTNLGAGAAWQFATLSMSGRATHAAPLTAVRLNALQDVVLKAEATRATTPAGRVERASASLSGNALSHTLSFAANEGAASVEGSLQASLADTPAIAWRGAARGTGSDGVGAAHVVRARARRRGSMTT